MKINKFFVLTMLGLSAYAAQNNQDPALTTSDKQAMQIARNVLNSNNQNPIAGRDYSINFLHGASIPVIICAPLKSTDISLQPGEMVKGLDAGDTVRWIISPEISGVGENEITHINIKPAQAGLATTLAIYTDKRAYHLQLVSHENEYYPVVTFSYQEDLAAKWDAYYKRKTEVDKTKKIQAAAGESDVRAQNSNGLDFNYKVDGKASWKPLRIYNDGQQTFIQMPKQMKFNEAPALLVLDKSDNSQIVNYRLKDDMFIVDKVFHSAELILGVGDAQEKIIITREQ